MGHTLAGIIRDDRSDAPLVGATVVLLSDSLRGTAVLRRARTDEQGQYKLAGVSTGRVYLRVLLVGYRTETRVVQAGDCGVRGCEDRKNVYLSSLARF